MAVPLEVLLRILLDHGDVVAGEQPVLDGEAHRVARVPGCMHHPDAQRSQRDRLSVAQAHVDEWRRARVVHHDRRIETPRELAIGGEMIRVRMRIDEVADAQSMLRGERQVTIDLARFRIYQRSRAGLTTTDQIGPAPTRRDLFEYHDVPLSMKGRRSLRRLHAIV